MKHVLSRGALIALAMLPTAAWAHPGLHGETSFMSGFLHPLTGIDHMLAMVAVGLLAACLGGRSLWAVPASFILAMVIGGALSVAGVHIPVVEGGIAASVIVLGVLVAIQAKISVAFAAALVALFGLFHGAAHGTEMPVDASLFGYTAGFVVATAILHALGIAIAFVAAALSERHSQNVARLGGGAVAIAGIVLTGASL
ncbi:HupE/UreJ family protein [Hyphomicrobium sp. CS1GBMeth3]|uniref:HupE/UreJ family protein n=1 Tax=Hyphomicrobium sp. CS1GBMeth3 TaxID=1892845 RepID=UPI0009318FBE|nr:HupE/UreJ family protein [Hyphomicrobium sp. CS1GBMeth3]